MSTTTHPPDRAPATVLRRLGIGLLAGVAGWAGGTAGAQTLAEQNAALLEKIRAVHSLDAGQTARLRAVFEGSTVLGQGNPAISRHPATPEACRERRAGGESDTQERFAAICGAPFMAPLYDPASERPEDARVCIDQFEFPSIPCAWPVVWVRASEAAEICEILGKRLCDAHEWEGACEGRLEAPDYRFDVATGLADAEVVRQRRALHNRQRGAEKRWSYGDAYREGVCAAASTKSEGCDGGGWGRCGSNTYPAGHFPACKSDLEVWDLHGNAAEHMNLPLTEEEMASRGSRRLGVTEMKGSWFIFDRYRAHEDWCRWRAPFWHGSRVRDPASHHNYHLGFRCCKTLFPATETDVSEGAD